MSTENQAMGGYGYASDEVKSSPFNFGLNAGNTFLTKFEWIPNGGQDGAEQEALEIVFNINGTERSYRQFPVTRAYDKNQNEVTDPNAPEMKEAFQDFNAKMTHILHCYQDIDTIKAAFSRPIKNFKEYCQIAMSILPKNYKEIPLDIFLQFQWTLKEGQERTYLEVPSKMKYGKWLSIAQEGTWTANKMDNPSDSDREALYYTNANGEKHPFVKNGWFMNSNLAHQQKADGTQDEAVATTAPAATTTGNAPAAW